MVEGEVFLEVKECGGGTEETAAHTNNNNTHTHTQTKHIHTDRETDIYIERDRHHDGVEGGAERGRSRRGD